MRHFRVLTAAALLLAAGAPCAAGPAAAESAAKPGVVPRTISPVFHQLVVFSLPPPFKAAFEKTNNGFYIREHVPQGQTVDEWTQMITLTGAQGLAYNREATPQAYLQALARGFQRHCPDTYVQLELGPQPDVGSASFVTVASCGRVTSGGKAHSETAVMMAFKGSDDYYMLQWAERGPDSGHPLALDSRYWLSRLKQLGPVRLCPIVPGEAPPYPSCVGH
jgi:hypothetical protein